MSFMREAHFSTLILLLLFSGYQGAVNINENEDSLAQVNKSNLTLSDYRLPKTIIPEEYEILLQPDFNCMCQMSGTVHIHVLVKEETDTITFHCGDIDISMVTVNLNGALKEIARTDYNETTEKYEIQLRETLTPDSSVKINLRFNGTIRDDMIGFYRSSYVDSDGKLKWLLSTQFQTTHARHAFPCFDEPSFKAKFAIKILRPTGYTSLSNMPLKQTIPVGEGVWDEFEQSIPMSTYLVAFVISDFSSVQSDNFKVWARPNAVGQANYALTTGKQALDALSKRFDQDYQISKMDMVAVPDFSAGAMENWGLVTYRESRLLYDENTTSDAAKQTIASVVVHELTHMWFGNQVTPEWWSYLWLSEAFARYFQYFGTALIEPAWKMEEQFLVEQHQTAYAADGVESSQPMTRNVITTSQIGSVGDTITYNKGGSILRMMNLIFGSDVYDAGIQNYLNNSVEKVGRPDNLWVEIQNELDHRNNSELEATVKEIMTTWTEQPGFPVVTVNIGNDNVQLKQERFLLRNLKSTPTNTTWWIPITWTTKKNPNFNEIKVAYWLNESVATIPFETHPDWTIFNVQSSGFYRVNYDTNSWYRIFDALNTENHQGIHVLNRAAIVDDLLNLARAGLLRYEVALDGLKYLVNEEHYLPFKAAFSAFTYLDQRLSGDDTNYNYFKKFVLMLIENKLEKLGYQDRPGDDRLTILLRNELTKWACKYDHQVCVRTFVTLFKEWREKDVTIKPNQRPVAYCMGAKHGTKEDWEFLWNQYYNSPSATEQEVLLQALGCTRDADLLERYLLYALKDFEESRIRKQDNSAVFSAVSTSGVFGAEFVLNFVRAYNTEMKEFYNETQATARILASASQRFSTSELVNKFDSLIVEFKDEYEDVLESLNNSLEIARYELLWYERYSSSIVSWIRSYTKDDTIVDYRLPTAVTPTAYSIWVTTKVSELDNFLFTGTVNINAIVKNDTALLVLHSVDLKHDKVSVDSATESIGVTDVKVDATYDALIINLNRTLRAGEEITILIEFEGQLNEVMRGFYRSWYMDRNGNKRWLAATQMEPVGSRKMFPCFDEPALKATFKMSVTIPGNYRAISNMPVDRQYLQHDTMKHIIFKETPKMSTYLVALVISDFASSETEKEVYGVWARSDAIAHTEYALSLMEPFVDVYERNLGIKYQLPKLRMLALPDFISGAMENWGLLTYKERNVLYDPLQSTTASKQSITNVISHEISHQWFGNLVTPLWWKYIWLNEGFARYFQYFATEEVTNHTWSLEPQFVVDHVHSALEADSLLSTHALTNDVEKPTEIRAMFDTITYSKGGSVLRMIEKLVGRDVFYKALQSYLKKRQYDSAVPEDLFDAFKDAITDGELKNSIHDIMNSWTTQAGYPVVHVTPQGNGSLQLRQERFLLKREKVATESTWHIPITWTCLDASNFNDTQSKYLLTTPTGNIEIGCKNYLLNVQQSGFYRINYDTEGWKRLINLLKSNTYYNIPDINRAAIIDDLLSLARAEYVDYDTAFNAVEFLRRESTYYPWRAFFDHLPYLYKQFQGKDVFDTFKHYVNTLLTPIYEALQFEDRKDNHVTQLFRSHVRKWACKFDVGNCRSQALSFFNKWNRDNTKAIPANYHGVSYCTAVEQNDPAIWNRLWNHYLQSTFAAEKSIVLQSLACTTDKALLNKLLDKVFSNNTEIRLEDISGVFTSIIDASPEGIESVISFVQNRHDEINKQHPDILQLDTILNTIEKNIYTYEIYEKYDKLINSLGKGKPWNENNHAYVNLRWSEKHIPRIHELLDTRYQIVNYRLPKTFTPLHYNVTLSPHFEEKNFMFDGSVQIHVKRLTKYTSHIVLHAHELNVINIAVYYKNSNLTEEEGLNVTSLALNTDTQMLSIFLNKFVQSDEIILDINFKGYLNDKMEGFYRSRYVNKEGKDRWLATTQFEPTYARKAFPCFDEPGLKAKFVINIERPKDYSVLSNMPRKSLIPSADPDRMWEVFDETVEMSTYAVAFVVSDFSPHRDMQEKIRVWGRPDIAPKGEFAQIAATRFLDFLAEETGHKYTLPKLDLIGIPDFAMGAMENWGLVTFREYGLFYDKDVTSAKYTDYIVTIIAHELSHMMFGNLVTCDWWEHIWLNEGFAEYMQWRLSQLYLPAFHYDDLFVVDELQAAMQADSAHPMNNPVSKPSEIKNMFDTVTYGKSSSVIRMIEKSLKPEIFTKALKQYLEKHQFSTATPTDLWQAFDDEIKLTEGLNDFPNIPMATLMDGWTNKPGYPLVFAKLDLSSKNLILTQKNFTTHEDIDDFWIPITLTTSTKKDFLTTTTDVWLGGTPLTINLDGSVAWFLLNIQQSGYYRVNYDHDSWYRIINALKTEHNLIHVTNRAQVIDDLLNLARAGHVSYTTALDGTVYLQHENTYLPWKAFINGMNFIVNRYEGQKNLNLVKNYMLRLMKDLFSEIYFIEGAKDTHTTQLNRELILTWACKLGNEECKLKSIELFKQWRSSKENTISPNARAAVYCTAIKHGSQEDWQFLWQQYVQAYIPSEKQIILNALGCTSNNTILNMYIKGVLTRKILDIRRQDINAVFASIYKTGKDGVDVMLDFILNNYMMLHDYYDSWEGLENLISKLAPYLSTTDQISKMSELKGITVLKTNYTNIKFTIESAVNFALNNQLWYDRHSNEIDHWLQNYSSSGNTIMNSLHISLMALFSVIVYMFNQ